MEQPQLSYPLGILPRFIYKKKLSIDKLLGLYNDLMIVRLVHGAISDYQIATEQGEMELSDSVFENSMANLSMNLSGGKFNTNPDGHLRYLAISNYGKADWDGKRVNRKEFLDTANYADNSPCFGLCFQVRDVHKQVFPFYKGFMKQEERDVFAQQVEIVTAEWTGSSDAKLVGAFKSKRETVKVYGRLEVHHAPTNGNYWHTTLDTYRPTGKELVRPIGDKESSDRRMFKALKQNLCQFCRINMEPSYTIASRYYLKWYAYIIPCIYL